MNLEIIKALIAIMIQKGIFNQEEIKHLKESMGEDETALGLLNTMIRISEPRSEELSLASTQSIPSFKSDASSSNLDAKITRILREIGVPAHIKGYQYSREAVSLLCGDITMIGAITKRLYPTIAEKFGTTPARVERAIRHSVELSFSKMNSRLNTLFPNIVKDKPTNSEFIATIADIILTGESIKYPEAK